MMDYNPVVAWFPSTTADSLPPVMLETDPRLSCQHLDDHLKSIISNGSQCPIYRYSNTLVYKPVCRKRETRLMTIAEDLTVPIVTKIGIVDDVSSRWYQKGALLGLGRPLDVTRILPAERVSIARQMLILVTGLHCKGIIHGDIKPENFVQIPSENALKVVGFSSARMVDNTDLNSWPTEIPSVEYISPDRGQNGEPSALFDDYFGLAVSIWSVFAGEWPTNGLFNSNEGHTPNLSKITDDELFCSVVDILKEGGLELDKEHTLLRRDSFKADGIDRVWSFPLSLFGPDLDDLDEPICMKGKPRFCPHCFEIAMSGADRARDSTEQLPAEYSEFCHLRDPRPNVDSVSDYALQWLDVQEDTLEEGTPATAIPQPNPRDGRPRSGSPAEVLGLHVDTDRNQEVERPQLSGASSVTITPANQAYKRERSNTMRDLLPTAPSESDEGYESMGRNISNAIKELEAKSQLLVSRLQRTMSAWSPSSVGSSPDDNENGSTETNEVTGDSWMLNGPSAAWTTMLPHSRRVQLTSSFESVTLSDTNTQGLDDGRRSPS
ncbi:hypothetical protein VPNG_09634 [Cytospora leucostoma]|uniref:Protein kinase domain-containing protein n=1 Tax=Cytospora leucostoma TaxID=1230097 RepID=A0A423VR48_9PEZI|nr:hypothetical protein VPNG_09634 [Cytospora leucostoma]